MWTRGSFSDQGGGGWVEKNSDIELQNKEDSTASDLDQGKFIPFKQTISKDANLNKPFVPLTVEDALARQKKKDK